MKSWRILTYINVPVFIQSYYYFYFKCYFIVGVIALRHLPTLLNVDVDVDIRSLWTID